MKEDNLHKIFLGVYFVVYLQIADTKGKLSHVTS